MFFFGDKVVLCGNPEFILYDLECDTMLLNIWLLKKNFLVIHIRECSNRLRFSIDGDFIVELLAMELCSPLFSMEGYRELLRLFI